MNDGVKSSAVIRSELMVRSVIAKSASCVAEKEVLVNVIRTGVYDPPLYTMLFFVPPPSPYRFTYPCHNFSDHAIPRIRIFINTRSVVFIVLQYKLIFKPI